MEAKMTKRGRELLCKAHAGEGTLSPITHIALGRGGCSGGAPVQVTGNETALAGELMKKEVESRRYSEETDESTGAAKVKMRYAVTLGSAELAGETISEAGLVDGEGNLIAYLTFLEKGKDEDMEVTFSIDELF